VAREEVVIVPYRDGPYLVRGPADVRDQEGHTIAVTRRVIALCRCGKSRMRPFCDGTHQLVRFSAPSQDERPRPPREVRERAGWANPPHDDAEREPRAVAIAQLARAGAKADSLLAASANPETQIALQTAVPLIGAARLLLAQSPPEPEPAAQIPCSCLIKEALTALGSAAMTSESGLGELIALLDSVARTLEPGGS
jgi:CDGSH-type Zn-finger protein